MGERAERRRLGQRGQVVGQSHQPQGVDRRGIGREVADAGAGERERLAHGARDEQSRPAVEQGERARRAGLGELEVRLVDDDDAARRVGHGRDGLERERRAGGVVRCAEQDDVGIVLAHRGDGGLGSQLEVERRGRR